jgi:hypothetical protein
MHGWQKAPDRQLARILVLSSKGVDVQSEEWELGAQYTAVITEFHDEGYIDSEKEWLEREGWTISSLYDSCCEPDNRDAFARVLAALKQDAAQWHADDEVADPTGSDRIRLIPNHDTSPATRSGEILTLVQDSE